MKLSFTLLFLMLSATLFAQSQQTGNLKGMVSDAETLEPLIGVNVYLPKLKSGTTTDSDGNFEIKNLNSGVYQVEFSYVGYETKTKTDVVIYSGKSQQMSVQLVPSSVRGEEVTITAGYFSKESVEKISSVSFNNEEIRRSPGAGQELSRIINTISGVASTGETSQDLYVRGGSVNENGFYIDNIPIPAVRHFETAGGQSNGPIGILNTDLIDDINFSTGGFDASYGNRLSAIGNISYRNGSSNGFSGKVGMNLSGFLANAESEYNNGKGSWIFSARRSYLDLIADALNTGGAPRYEDYQGKVHHKINNNHTLDILAIYGESLFEQTADQAREQGMNEYPKAGNTVLTTGANHTWLHSDGYTKTSLSFSQSTNNTEITDLADNEIVSDLDLKQHQVNLRSVTFKRLSDDLQFEAGTDQQLEFNQFNYFFDSFNNSYGQTIPTVQRDESLDGWIGAGFGSVQVDLTPKLSFNTGLRVTMNSYNQDLDWDPRVKLSYSVLPDWSLYGSIGWYTQTVPRYLLSQRSDFEGLPNMRARHIIIGTNYLLTDDTNLRIELYDKAYSDIPQPPANTQYVSLGYVPDQIGSFYDELLSNGEAYARGAEVMLQKKLAENFYGLVSASYFRSRYQDYTGTWRDRDYDNRYLLNLIGGYRPSDTWELSIRWSYMGGRPASPVDPTASANANDTRFNVNRYNEVRLPAFHSLYLRYDHRFFFDSFSLVTFFETWNTYNRKNIVGRYWNTETQSVDESEQFSILPVGGFIIEF